MSWESKAKCKNNILTALFNSHVEFALVTPQTDSDSVVEDSDVNTHQYIFSKVKWQQMMQCTKNVFLHGPDQEQNFKWPISNVDRNKKMLIPLQV